MPANLSGKLTLTKIKDVFAIMKNLVLESRTNGGGSGGGRGPAIGYDGLEGSGGGGDPELQKQVRDLKSCLLQRDNEIAILVNMVKKGKTVGDVNMAASAASSRGSSGAGPMRHSQGKRKCNYTYIHRHAHNTYIFNFSLVSNFYFKVPWTMKMTLVAEVTRRLEDLGDCTNKKKAGPQMWAQNQRNNSKPSERKQEKN